MASSRGYDRETLYREVSSTPMFSLAKQYGVSDQGLRPSNWPHDAGHLQRSGDQSMRWRSVKRLSLVTVVASLITGCANSPHLYGGEPKPLSEVARVSLMGYQRQAGVVIKKIDGRSWDYGPVVYLLPGEHTFELSVSTSPNLSGGMITWQGALVTATTRVEAGHAYLPETEVLSGKAYVRFVDAGTDFPDACMPSRVAINNSQVAFASLHKDGSKCDRPMPSLNNVR